MSRQQSTDHFIDDDTDSAGLGLRCLCFLSNLQYSPKIMHAQEVAQEVLAPQEHASGEKKLNCALICKKFQT